MLMMLSRQTYGVTMKKFDEFLQTVGNAPWLAAQLGISASAVWQWRTSQIPANRVLAVEKLTGISRHDLRSDIYPREDQ